MKWPVGKREWSVRKTTRNILYKIKSLTRTDTFGTEGVIDESKRKANVTCTTEDSCLLCVNKAEFTQLFNQSDIEKIRLNEIHYPSQDQIIERL